MSIHRSDEDYVEQIEREIKEQKAENDQLRKELAILHQNLDEANEHIARIQHSVSWKILWPLRKIHQKYVDVTERSVWTHKANKALNMLLHGRWKEFKDTYRRFQYVMKNEGHTGKEGVIIDKGSYNLLKYDSEYQDNKDYSHLSTDVKPLAFYLPQYHSFQENDEWWGKGFTEWVNVKSGTPRFQGHYQPREPHSDFGYYNLTDIEIIKKQARLAKQHGIYGFVFYYYWFSGKRLMERPVDMLLSHPEIDLPFCLCWANENWTRAWDGKNKDVLIGQEYSEKDDHCFMEDLKPYLDDRRYIRIHGKPLIIVYRPGQIPDCHKTFAAWRKSAREIGIGDILIWTCETANDTAESLKILDCIDAIVEFPPHNMWYESIAIRNVDLKGKSAFLYHYGDLVKQQVDKLREYKPGAIPVHHGIMMGWDNAARRKNEWFTYCGFSLKALYRWMLAVRKRTEMDFRPEERFCFINAWNEWGEGTYLEPDRKYGYANINTVSKALHGLPLNDDLKAFSDTPVSSLRENITIAVQVHMFYLETLEETVKNLNHIPFDFDCFISTDTEAKRITIQEMMSKACKARKTVVQVFENRGRDVGPFLVQMKKCLQNYDYICHIHSKKTRTNDHGNEWRKYNFWHLFGSENNVYQIIREFERDPGLGMIMPETYPVLELQAEWGGNLEGVQQLLQRMGYEVDLPHDPVFPVGNMFWARSKAIRPIFDLNLNQDDFPKEQGQTNATIAHQIERCWVYMMREQGYRYLKTFNNCSPQIRAERRKRLCLFVHYNAENTVSAEDLKTLHVLSSFMDEVQVISNSILSEKELQSVMKTGPNISCEQRKNIGMDFGAWRDALLEMGQDRLGGYDELILCNNSFFPPVFPLDEMFASMEEKCLDFWGNTIFPRIDDGAYIHRDYIPEHLQSYWMVFEKKAIQSKAFWNFWEQMPDYMDYIDVVANCESQLTEILAKNGLTYEPYIRETYYMSRFLNCFALPYEKPSSLLLLRDGLIKKKCYQYMSEEERIKLEYYWRILTNNNESGMQAMKEYNPE